MTTQVNKPKHPPEIKVSLPTTGTWPDSHYLLDGKAQDAVALAVACGRPLLVRGLPGTGKSDLARAAAEHLNRAFVYEVVTARTEPLDLLWRFDAIARLADAQAEGASQSPICYVSPGPLWWALNWKSAQQRQTVYDIRSAQGLDLQAEDQEDATMVQQERAEMAGTVLLLDEIDKADSELPNSLLEVLANTGFKTPWGAGEVKPVGKAKPLIIITTNEDRELPPAFVRRCLVLNISVDSDFSVWINKRARVHFHDPDSKEKNVDKLPELTQIVLDKAAEQLMADRENHGSDGPQPGLAEYLDLLRGLQQMAPESEKKQLELLFRVSQFSYQKHPE